MLLAFKRSLLLVHLGMVELISECETLRKIQTSSGITGSFKDQPLANWLQKHNPTHNDYAKVNITLQSNSLLSRTPFPSIY
jgi:hypothetical protein